MKKIQKSLQTVLFFTLSALTLQVQADRLSGRNEYYPKNFYGDVNAGLKDKALKQALNKILTSAHVPTPSGNNEIQDQCKGERNCYQHSPITYNEARRFILGKLDLLHNQNGYALRDVYCGNIFTKKDFGGGQGPNPDQIPDHNVFNVEHTWPQSRFSSRFPKHFQKADLFILYGTSTKANSSRQNLQFADVQTEQSPVCPSVRRGWVRGNSGEVFFEPPDEHKGNVARALFYFATRYGLEIKSIEEESLKRWHKLDPVDDVERSRQEEIFRIQHTRNPFIDHPELADLISDF